MGLDVINYAEYQRYREAMMPIYLEESKYKNTA